MDVKEQVLHHLRAAAELIDPKDIEELVDEEVHSDGSNRRKDIVSSMLYAAQEAHMHQFDRW